jgi:hypothetical protein
VARYGAFKPLILMIAKSTRLWFSSLYGRCGGGSGDNPAKTEADCGSHPAQSQPAIRNARKTSMRCAASSWMWCQRLIFG